MNAAALSTQPDTGEHEDMDSEWEGLNIVAACLVQHPPYVVPDDHKWHENAELLVGMRNALPELMRPARRGFAVEARASEQIGG